jgi:nucleotide-binding universal stress UspA family protein
MYTRIVVPLDGSALAEQALSDAQQLASKLGAPLHLVRVVDVTRLERYGAYGLALEYAGLAEVASEEERQAREYLTETSRKLAGNGLTVTTEVGRGLVVPVLSNLAKPGDLIVMASHGRSGISRWFLGSVAEEFVRRAHVPVLIVRATQPPA